MKYNLKSVRAHLLREDFQRFWEYVSPGWAEKFLDQWCCRTMRSQLEPMKPLKSPCIIAWELYPNQNSQTNSGEEAFWLRER